MHMKVIYGTSSKYHAKEIIKELKQGENLADIIDADRLYQFIPEADYVTVDAFDDEDKNKKVATPKEDWGKIPSDDRKDVFHLVSEYFNSQYFDLTEG